MKSRPGTSSDSSGQTLGLVWAGVLFVVLVLLIPGLERPGEAPREAWLMVSVPLLLVLTGFRGGWNPSLWLGGALGLVLVLGLASLATVPASEHWCVARDLGILAIPWLAAWIVSGEKQSVNQRLGQAGVWALWVLAPIGLAQAWFGWEGIPQARPPAATFANRNVAAETLVVLIPLALTALKSARSVRGRFIVALSGGLGTAFLIATRSRGGWVAALVGWGAGLLLLGWTQRGQFVSVWHEWRIPALAFLIPSLAALIVPVRGAEPLPSVMTTVTTFSREGAEGSLAIRSALRQNTLAMIEEHPLLGVGPGRFAVIYPLFQSRVIATPGFGTERQPEHVENDFLETAAELGIPAGLVLFGLIGWGLIRAGRFALLENDGENRGWWGASVAGITGILVHGLVAFPLQSPSSALLFWILIGRTFVPPSPINKGTILRRQIFGAVGLALLGLGAFTAYHELCAQKLLGTALESRRTGLTAPVATDARTAAETAPWVRRDRALAAILVFDSEKDPAASLAVLEPALERHPNHLNLLLATGARRLKAHRPAEAEQAFRHALFIKDDFGRPWLGLAMSLDAQSRRPESNDACRHALRFNDLPEARTYCGPAP